MMAALSYTTTKSVGFTYISAFLSVICDPPMQRDPTSFTGNPTFAYGYQGDGCIVNGSLGGLCNYGVPASPAFTPAGMTSPKIQSPLGVFEFQPSKVCPRNLIIMYHPTLVNKLTPTNMDVFPCHGEVVCRSSSQDNDNTEEESSFKEDSIEIDALLSSDEESDEDDVMSTGRSPDPLDGGPFDSSSPPRHFSGKSSVYHGFMENVTHEKIRKMVTVLRGIVPGGDQLDAHVVLDEAVGYLKFLKMEAKKHDVEGLDK